MGDKLVGNEEREEMLTKFDEILTSRQMEWRGETGDLSLPNKKTKRDSERLDRERERERERERKEKETSDGKKEAKAKARKIKV